MTTPATTNGHRRDVRRRTITLVGILLILVGVLWLFSSASTAHAAPPKPTPKPKPTATAVATPSGPVQVEITSVKAALGVYYIKLADGRGGVASPRGTQLPAPEITTGPATLTGTTLTQSGGTFFVKLACPKGTRCT